MGLGWWGGVGCNNVSLLFFPVWVWVGGVGWGVITSLCSSSPYGFGLVGWGGVGCNNVFLLVFLVWAKIETRCCYVIRSLLFHLPATLKHFFISSTLLLRYNISSVSSSCYAPIFISSTLLQCYTIFFVM